jgi:hypothetical protein
MKYRYVVLTLGISCGKLVFRGHYELFAHLEIELKILIRSTPFISHYGDDIELKI